MGRIKYISGLDLVFGLFIFNVCRGYKGVFNFLLGYRVSFRFYTGRLSFFERLVGSGVRGLMVCC